MQVIQEMLLRMGSLVLVVLVMPILVLRFGWRYIDLFFYTDSSPVRLIEVLWSELGTLSTTANVLIVSWIGGVLVSALQYDLIRVLGGYGRWNPLVILDRCNIRLFSETAKLNKLLDERELARNKMRTKKDYLQSEKLQDMKKFNILDIALARDFLGRDSIVLPTRFGNIHKSMERYPIIMYGIDSVVMYQRLLAVVPNTFLDKLYAVKDLRDVWVNLGYVLFILTLRATYSFGYTNISSVSSRSWTSLLLVFVFCMLLWFCYVQAVQAARLYGNWYKALFDLYATNLGERLGIDKGLSSSERRDLWNKRSQEFLYAKPGRIK